MLLHLTLSVQDYLFKIRIIVDALASIGYHIPTFHHSDMILEGLIIKYAPVVSVVETKFGFMDIDEVKTLLLVHEFTLAKFKKQLVPGLISLNLTNVTPQSNFIDSSLT